MTDISRTAVLWFRSDNRKPVVSNIEPSALQNRKWAGIFAIALTFAVCGVVVEAQQPAKILPNVLARADRVIR